MDKKNAHADVHDVGPTIKFILLFVSHDFYKTNLYCRCVLIGIHYWITSFIYRRTINQENLCIIYSPTFLLIEKNLQFFVPFKTHTHKKIARRSLLLGTAVYTWMVLLLRIFIWNLWRQGDHDTTGVHAGIFPCTTPIPYPFQPHALFPVHILPDQTHLLKTPVNSMQQGAYSHK